MMFKKIVAGILGVMLFAMQPVQLTFAEEVQVQDGDLNSEEKTAEQLAAEAERKEALETPSETDQLENWPAGPAVYAHSAIVMDMNSGAILYSKKAEERHFPASITKLLTTLVALENAELTDKVTFSQASVDILNWDDAHIGMRPGEEISMKDALRAVLLASANEVSYAVAESTGITHLNGGYNTFIELMNTRAKEDVYKRQLLNEAREKLENMIYCFCKCYGLNWRHSGIGWINSAQTREPVWRKR